MIKSVSNVSAKRWRAGSAVVEVAVVVSVLMLVVVAMLDVTIAVFRYNTLSAAAREGARKAIVRGELAPPKQTQWGPTTFSAQADSGHEITEAVRPMIIGMDPSRVLVVAEWIDGGVKLEQRVRITVSTNYTPMLTTVFNGRTFVLRASSTMPIVH